MVKGLGNFKIKRIGAGLSINTPTPKFLGKVGGINRRGRPKGSRTRRRSFGIRGL